MKEKIIYKKPQITRIKLKAGEAVMANCSSVTQRTLVVKSGRSCNIPGSCRNAVS